MSKVLGDAPSRAQPGPWFASEMVMDKKSWASLNDGKVPVNIVMAGSDGMSSDVVAAVWCGDDFDEAKTANLIAAAPDMLGALIQVRARFQGLRLGPDEAATLSRVNDAIDRACRGAR